MRKRFFVLEIGDSLIKAAFIENIKGNVSIKDIATFSKSKEEIKAGIKRFRRYRLRKKNTIILIPAKKAMLRYLELPSRDEAELRDMINFQLPRYLPYNFGDITFGFKIVEEKIEGYSKVMIACIQKKFFSEILETIPHLEDNLYGVFLCGEVAPDLLRGESGVRALIDISSEEVILSIYDPFGTIFMRSLDTRFFINEKNWAKGVEELDRSFVAFGREFSERKIKSVVITGARAYIANFYNFLKARGHAPVELFDPFDYVKCAKALMEGLDKFSFHAIIGAAAGIDKRHINLISQNFLSKRERQFKIRERLQVLFLVIIIISQLFFIFYKEIGRKKNYLKELEDGIRKTEEKARVIEDKEKRLSLIKTQLNMEVSALGALREVYRVVSPDISINVLIFEKDKFIRLRGTARAMAEVFNLIPELEKSPYFDKVISEGTKMRKLKDSVVADFQLLALFKKNDKSQ